MNDTSTQQTPTQPPPPPTEAKPSEFWTVFILSLLLGAFGVHRFYARKFKSGAVQLVTLGLCGLWSLVDVVTILLGKFKNAAGVVYRNPKPGVSWGIFAVVCIIAIIGGAGGGGSTTNGGGGSPESSSSVASEPKSKVYLCQSPASTLRLATDHTGAMTLNGNAWEGSWSEQGSSIVFKPDNAGPLTFTVQNDGSLVSVKYGYKYENVSK